MNDPTSLTPDKPVQAGDVPCRVCRQYAAVYRAEGSDPACYTCERMMDAYIVALIDSEVTITEERITNGRNTICDLRTGNGAADARLQAALAKFRKRGRS